MLIDIIVDKNQIEKNIMKNKNKADIDEFKRLTDTLFGEHYHYQPEKSDKDILSEVLSEKYA